MTDRDLFYQSLHSHILSYDLERAGMLEKAYKNNVLSRDYMIKLAIQEGKSATSHPALFYLIALVCWTYKAHTLKDYENPYRFMSMNKSVAIDELEKEMYALNNMAYEKGKKGIEILIREARNGSCTN